jgi:neutral amino acid transport system permease protein
VTIVARASVLALVGLATLAILAVPAASASEGPIVLAQEEDEEEEGGEALVGTIIDSDGDPVPDVTIIVETAEGEPVGEGVTETDGTWIVPLPGPGDYRATLIEETLPEEIALRNPDRATLEFSMRPGQERTLLYPLGEGEAVGRGFINRFSQALVTGIKFGLIIAMAAVGLSLIFGTTGLINFSHGELVTFGAVVAFLFNASGALGFTIHLVPATLIAIAAGAGMGYSLERGLWRPLRARKVGLFQMLVISIGLMFLIRHIIVIFFGSRSRQYVGYAIQSPLEIGTIRITPRDLTVMAVSLVVLLTVAAMLERTRLGKAMRAVADNRNLAESSGIDVQRIILLIWVMGGALAATGGVFVGTVENVSWLMGFRLLLLMFAGVILGGLGTAYGAIVGSLVVGIVTEVSVVWFSAELKLVWALIALIIILLVRPQGILGIKERIG